MMTMMVDVCCSFCEDLFGCVARKILAYLTEAGLLLLIRLVHVLTLCTCRAFASSVWLSNTKVEHAERQMDLVQFRIFDLNFERRLKTTRSAWALQLWSNQSRGSAVFYRHIRLQHKSTVLNGLIYLNFIQSTCYACSLIQSTKSTAPSIHELISKQDQSLIH